MLVITDVPVLISSTTTPPGDEHVKVDKEQIVWSSKIGEVTVVFEDETPFKCSEFDVPEKGSANSGLPIVEPRREGYKYSIFKDNKLLFDPKVFIDK